jgi:hypothetical protein
MIKKHTALEEKRIQQLPEGEGPRLTSAIMSLVEEQGDRENNSREKSMSCGKSIKC